MGWWDWLLILELTKYLSIFNVISTFLLSPQKSSQKSASASFSTFLWFFEIWCVQWSLRVRCTLSLTLAYFNSSSAFPKKGTVLNNRTFTSTKSVMIALGIGAAALGDSAQTIAESPLERPNKKTVPLSRNGFLVKLFGSNYRVNNISLNFGNGQVLSSTNPSNLSAW